MTFFKKSPLLILMCLLFSNGTVAAEYKIAVRAHHGVEHATKQWQSTVDALSKQLPKHQFTLLPILKLNDITKQASQDKFDFVLTNPSSIVELEQLYGAKTLVTLNNKRSNTAQSQFGSVIFTHIRNTDILKIKDLKGKKLMAVSEPAFGGWRVAWLEMLDQGFNPVNQLKALMFTEGKTHPEVVESIRDGKADAGVVRTDLLERMEAAGKIDMRYFRIINNKDIKGFPFFLSTKLYPEWAIASMKTVQTEHAEQVKKVLLGLSAESVAAKKGKYVGWLPALDYSSVRNLMKKLQVGPYAN